MSDQARRTLSIPLRGSALGAIARFATLVVLAVATTGCSTSHRVTFKDANYVTDARKNSASVVAVIDQAAAAPRGATRCSWAARSR